MAGTNIRTLDYTQNLLTPADFVRIKSWGLNEVQIWVSWGSAEPEMGVYNETLFSELDSVVSWATAAGLKIILKVQLDRYYAQQGIWGGQFSMEDLWTNPAVQERFYQLWEKLVKRYRTYASIIGWHLLNEPTPTTSPGPWTDAELAVHNANWNDGGVSDAVIARIRHLDMRSVYITYGPWGNQRNYAPPRVPRPYANIVYSFCQYQPHDVPFNGVTWTGDKAEIIGYLQIIKTFRDTYGVPIYCNEVGINTRDFPITADRLKWLDDSLKALNGLNMNWCIYIYSHWGYGWSVMSEGNELPLVEVIKANVLAPTPTPRFNLVGAILAGGATYLVTGNPLASLATSAIGGFIFRKRS